MARAAIITVAILNVIDLFMTDGHYTATAVQMVSRMLHWYRIV